MSEAKVSKFIIQFTIGFCSFIVISSMYACLCNSFETAYDCSPSDYPIGSYYNGNLINNQTDQILAANMECANGGVIYLGNKNWEIDKGILLHSNQTWTCGTLTNKTARYAVLTADASAGDSIIQVDNGVVFKNADFISIAGGTAYGDTEYPPKYVLSGNENEVILGAPISGDFEIGDTLFTTHHMFKSLNYQNNTNIVLESLIFNGNRANNRFTHDWRFNSNVKIAGLGHTISRCKFINVPCENIVMGNGVIEKCIALNLDGSFVHISSLTPELSNLLIVQNKVINVCQTPLSENGHNEGCITYSWNAVDIFIQSNDFSNGGECVLGTAGASGTEYDCPIYVENNVFNNFPCRIANEPEGCHTLVDNTWLNIP